jgi:hypothetical protein
MSFKPPTKNSMWTLETRNIMLWHPYPHQKPKKLPNAYLDYKTLYEKKMMAIHHTLQLLTTPHI